MRPSRVLQRSPDRHTLPAEAGDVAGAAFRPDPEVGETEHAVQISEGPRPVAARAFQPAETRDFLTEQGVPVAIWDEFADNESALLKVVLVPVPGEPGAVVVRRHVDVRGKGRGQDQNSSGPEQAGELVQSMRGLRYVLQHLAAEDSIKLSSVQWVH